MQNSINILEVTKSLEKIKMYNREESINFDDIVKKISDINNNYTSDNCDKLNELKNELYNKFSAIKNNHYNNEIILNKNINLIINTSNTVEVLFSDIR